VVNPLAPDDPRRVGPFALEGRLGGALSYVGRGPDGVAAAVTVAAPGPTDPEVHRRFAHAVTALGRIRDPHVAALAGADAMATSPWLATEYADGPSLHAVVAERGPLPLPEIRRLVADLAGALAAIHEVGLAHHDLTADTVLLPPDGTRLVGLAVGRQVDPRADVAALGALIIHLATGRPDAPVDEVPEPLRTLARRCLADAADRPTPAEVRAAAHSPLDYVGTDPPADPLDLSAGVAVPVVGPLTAPIDEPDENPLAYPAAAPPENPLDLSAGIPGDAIVGPIPAQAEPGPPEAITYAGTAPPANPLDLSTGLPAEAIVEPAVDEAGEETGEPAVVDTITTPPHRSRRRRRLASVIAAVVLVASAVVLLVRDHSTAGTPIAAPSMPVPETSAGGPTCTGAKRLAGSGSALQHDAMLAIAAQWATHCVGSTLDYVPVGTVTGLQQFATGETELAVADHPLGAGQADQPDQANPGEIAAAAARCAGVGAPANKDLVLQMPAMLTPIVLTYRLTDVAELRLDAPAVTAIFSGKVTRWNDPMIAELNPGIRLPAVVITVIARTGQAVSTQTFQQYLTVAGGWTSGDGPEFTGTTTAPQRTDADVRATVRAVEGAIGYLPLPATRSTDEPVVSLVTGGGTAAEPDAASVNAAVDEAMDAMDTVDGGMDTAPGGPDDFTRLPAAILKAGTDETHPTDQVGDGPAPYPLVHVGYVVACTQYPGKGTAPAVRDFLLTALGMQVESARGYQLPLGSLRLRLVDLVQRTY
jgi:phosphate transport system substrate-binding protein